MLKALFVFGTRPEAIKLCPVVLEMRSRPKEFSVSVAVTAQHREMLDQVLSVFGVVPLRLKRDGAGADAGGTLSEDHWIS